MRKDRMPNDERNWRMLGSALAATGALALAGCSSSKPESSTTVDVPSRSAAASAASRAAAKLIFDNLHSNASTIIQVYPGYTGNAADKKFNGTFKSGDIVSADCKVEGRTVHSDPGDGEEARTSSEWVKIEGTPGETQYATAVYVQNTDALLKQLPNC